MTKFSNLPNLSEIKKQIVTTASGEPLVHHYTLFFKKDNFVASGSSFDDQDAKKKAYSEAVERLFVKHANPSLFNAWKFNYLDTTDCMAAGFSLEKTIERSNFEAAERACRLLFEDGELLFDSPLGENISDKLEKFSDTKFDGLSFYRTNIAFRNFSNARKSVNFVVAYEDSGEECFLGYSLGEDLSACLEQSSIEAYRNKIIYQRFNDYADQWVDRRYYKKLRELVLNKSTISEMLRENSGKLKQEVVLPRISWQITGSYNGSFICRSFIDGFLTDNKSGSIDED